MDVQGQSIVVTGAASGIGAAVARHLMELGGRVAILDLKPTADNSYSCDVSNAAQAEEVFTQIEKRQGPVSICVNCAGIVSGTRIVGKQGPHSLEEFNRVIQINLVGTFNIMRLAAAQMMQREPQGAAGERGVIINTASIAAFEGQIGQAAYSASKGGVVAMTLPAAREFAKFGIRVNTIAPGIIQTPMMAGMSDEVQTSLAASVPFPHRLGQPEEFARLTQHIVENAYLNGSTIRLDGALRLP